MRTTYQSLPQNSAKLNAFGGLDHDRDGLSRSGLIGPFALSVRGICDQIRKKVPGVFAIGYSDGGRGFCFYEIGRSESDLQLPLIARIGSQSLYKFRYVASAEAAFIKECEIFHSFAPPGNRAHPARSPRTNWLCPWCLSRGLI